VDQKLIMTGSLDNMSEKELEAKLKQILDDHKNIINISEDAEDVITESAQASLEESKQS
jgi:hypothetical protein